MDSSQQLPQNPTQRSQPHKAATDVICARLKKRADFKRLSSARRAHGRGFSVAMKAQIPSALPQASLDARIGFTVTKQCGNAVARNRIRRRLKEAMRLDGQAMTQSGHDYVIFGRREALSEDFARLRSRLASAIASLHQSPSVLSSSNPTPKPAAASI